MTETTNTWKNKALLIGALLGALLGLSTAYLLTRTADERGGQPPQISTGDAIKTAIGIIGVVRGIASLGDN